MRRAQFETHNMQCNYQLVYKATCAERTLTHTMACMPKHANACHRKEVHATAYKCLPKLANACQCMPNISGLTFGDFRKIATSFAAYV